jgi:hypothetical protein
MKIGGGPLKQRNCLRPSERDVITYCIIIAMAKATLCAIAQQPRAKTRAQAVGGSNHRVGRRSVERREVERERERERGSLANAEPVGKQVIAKPSAIFL